MWSGLSRKRLLSCEPSSKIAMGMACPISGTSAPIRRWAGRSIPTDVLAANSARVSKSGRSVLSSSVPAQALPGTIHGRVVAFHGVANHAAWRAVSEGETDMTKVAICCLTLSLFFAFTGTALGNAPDDVRDANGRLVECSDEKGRTRRVHLRRTGEPAGGALRGRPGRALHICPPRTERSRWSDKSRRGLHEADTCKAGQGLHAASQHNVPVWTFS